MMSEEATDLVLVDETLALMVLQDPEKFDTFYARVKQQTDTLVPDLTTTKGRREIASMARRVVKTKTFIDAQRKVLTEDARNVIDAADRAGKLIRDRLDALRDEVRKPLTDWEAVEERREEDVKVALAHLRNEAIVLASETSDDINFRMGVLDEMKLDSDLFRDALPIAEALKTKGVDALIEARNRALSAEQDARDLAVLRAQEAERQRIEDEHAEAVRQEEIRLADIARLQQAERDHEEQQRLDIERAAEMAREEERQRLAAEHAAQVRRIQDEADEANRERHEIQRKENQRLAAEAEEKAAADHRAKDRAYKSTVMSAAKEAIILVAENGNSDLEPGRIESIAIQIVRAIVAGEIPSVTLAF